MDKFKKYWPMLAHIGGMAILFLNPSVEAYASKNPGLAAPIVLAWGFLLHRAQSPVQK